MQKETLEAEQAAKADQIQRLRDTTEDDLWDKDVEMFLKTFEAAVQPPAPRGTKRQAVPLRDDGDDGDDSDKTAEPKVKTFRVA